MRINCDVNLHKFYDRISTRLSKIIMLIAIVASTKSLFRVMIPYSLFVRVVPAILVLIMMIYSGMFKSIKESFYSFMYSLLESTTDTWKEDNDDFKDEYKDSYITSNDDESVNNLSIIEYESVISSVIYGVSIIMLITVIFR